EADIARIQDLLRRQGAEIVTPREEPVHVSGHAKRDELREMYALVRPAIAIPVHGTPELMAAHGDLALSCGARQALVPKDGLVMRLAGRRAHAIGEIDVGLFADTGAGLVPWPGAAPAPVAESAPAAAPLKRAAKADLKPPHRSRRRRGRRPAETEIRVVA
ncbi:MAG TPA: MBL fold metallo-hydrolase RNA specificity domain-containing protein, partial [Alphaproteobacteria bacterium]|nr:MBL fold metallo-hydrolase RNA specificity domain-containing protein [Alphaproteobacteria bacterium]